MGRRSDLAPSPAGNFPPAALGERLPWPDVGTVGGWWNRRFDPETDPVGADRGLVAKQVWSLRAGPESRKRRNTLEWILFGERKMCCPPGNDPLRSIRTCVRV
ncbi:hypothetical protein B0T44_01975 [Nocardia donostiensis]|uniref:Uncharacterized protein n=1 Tax=Nocardia donostiensis TaxID=1538463 RepID=A0A1W0BM91_9NOCA|nr:hypothetical protein B0T46_03440 [Nocardia donostiensis]OQS15813.1 hypothetical protein B0T36_07535 [Nocardia donostiensis]OQS23618.1 hypothetical protein B0T44_01975 [Nocardia donostiensis]